MGTITHLIFPLLALSEHERLWLTVTHVHAHIRPPDKLPPTLTQHKIQHQRKTTPPPLHRINSNAEEQHFDGRICTHLWNRLVSGPFANAFLPTPKARTARHHASAALSLANQRAWVTPLRNAFADHAALSLEALTSVGRKIRVGRKKIRIYCVGWGGGEGSMGWGGGGGAFPAALAKETRLTYSGLSILRWCLLLSLLLLYCYHCRPDVTLCGWHVVKICLLLVLSSSLMRSLVTSIFL